MNSRRADPRPDVARHAARLFVERGVAGTSGADIAAAAGLSTRTVWRYFRTKESCVEPLFSTSALRFVSVLREWPAERSIEDWLHAALPLDPTSLETADAVLAVRLIARLPEEPALRSAWLMSCHLAEEGMVEAISRRLRRWPDEFEVRLCAAAVIAAVRVVDETISIEAVKQGRRVSTEEAIDRLAAAIRTASTLPICDPVA